VLAALDRRQARLAGDASHAEAVRLARANAQVAGILADRTREALWEASRRARTEATLRAVAAHELDPYAAADRLLEDMARAGATRHRNEGDRLCGDVTVHDGSAPVDLSGRHADHLHGEAQ
jgi:hypothetical protein